LLVDKRGNRVLLAQLQWTTRNKDRGKMFQVLGRRCPWELSHILGGVFIGIPSASPASAANWTFRKNLTHTIVGVVVLALAVAVLAAVTAVTAAVRL